MNIEYINNNFLNFLNYSILRYFFHLKRRNVTKKLERLSESSLWHYVQVSSKGIQVFGLLGFQLE